MEEIRFTWVCPQCGCENVEVIERTEAHQTMCYHGHHADIYLDSDGFVVEVVAVRDEVE